MINWAFVGTGALITRLKDTVDPRVLLPVFRKYSARVEAFLKVYPTEPPASTYDRTGLLGQAWQSDARYERGSVVAEAWNTRNYAPGVQGSATQWKVHRGRWRTDEDALDEVSPGIVSELGMEIERNF